MAQEGRNTSSAVDSTEMNEIDPPEFLELKVHGRVLEHLGIQMYESPVNAIAELVANSWDADADQVRIDLPDRAGPDVEIKVQDDGLGMTPKECQDKYLYVGWNRRGNDPSARSLEKNRHVLGRKGIGKFAGFGIAEVMRIDTTSKETGERTVFELRLNALMGQEYIGPGSKKIKVLEYEGPDENRAAKHGTTVILKQLRISRKIRSDFPKSMARRFLLLQRQAGFTVTVNGKPLPSAIEIDKAQYIFPRDYRAKDRPEGITTTGQDLEGGWGWEKIGDHMIKWRFLFHTDTIEEEELRGVTIFANGKMVQAPFLFQLTGGLRGQHGVEYLTGQVEADYLDRMPEDVVTTERQRINWSHDAAEPLLQWGRHRVKSLLEIWGEMRGEKRRKEIEQKVSQFSKRLGKLPPSEQKIVRQALSKLGSITTLSDHQFDSLGTAILTAWEQGRLRKLIDEIAEARTLSAEELLGLFTEMDVLTALNVAEAVQTRLLAVGELQRRIDAKQLENKVRDYIADHPYLLAPAYETFKVERNVRKFLDDMNVKAKMPDGAKRKRIDLALASGAQLVLFEFMRPGLTLDWDHIGRYELYFRTIRTNVRANTGGDYTSFTGYVVADKIEADSVVQEKVDAMRADNMLAMDWNTLVHRAFKAYEEHFDALAQRNPHDERLKALAALRQ